MFFPALKLPLYRLSDEVGAFFALLQDRVHAVKSALREPAGDLLEINLFSAHPRNIDDITNCYKPHFRGYHLFTLSRLLISSIQQLWETAMAKNYERQMRAIQNLAIAPRESCDVVEFATEEWATGHVFVRRTFVPRHARSLSYTQGIVVGPRGGTKTLYDHTNY